MVVNMKFIPWRPLVSEKLPFRTSILNEMTIAIKRLERGVKLSYMIYGPLGIGKTSLLLSLKKILEPLPAIVPIYLNPTWNFLTFTDFKDILLDTLSKVKTKVEIREFNTLITYINEGRLGLAFELLDKLLIDNGLYAVLMIDDVSTITRMSRYSDLKITPYSLFETILDRTHQKIIEWKKNLIFHIPSPLISLANKHLLHNLNHTLLKLAVQLFYLFLAVI